MIKINDVNKSSELSAGKVKKSGGGAEFSSYLSETLKSSNAPVSGLSNVNVADAIFAAQMVDGQEEKERRKKMLKRGSALLDKLDEIRSALLNGYMSMDKLIEISRFVKEPRFSHADDELTEIIAEIELRVEVELAKLMK